MRIYIYGNRSMDTYTIVANNREEANVFYLSLDYRLIKADEYEIHPGVIHDALGDQ